MEPPSFPDAAVLRGERKWVVYYFGVDLARMELNLRSKAIITDFGINDHDKVTAKAATSIHFAEWQFINFDMILDFVAMFVKTTTIDSNNWQSTRQSHCLYWRMLKKTLEISVGDKISTSIFFV
ncbi:hypothetical protein BCR42DRAFT_398604 [Absidia repens]|uniref:Uncharacterized protein n=1 Tax=Absidia repens TaxID=90262 RepID=A0A1X2HYW8_9FUNG|nr:hypothetical protein BCR42DRAFT_398604 [Absidia repens]